MALLEAARHIGQGIDPETAQGDDENRQPGQAVRIEVAEDEDSLAGVPRSDDPRPCDLHVWQQ